MNNGPSLWNKLLNEAPKNSILMGGAVVDYQFGWTVKDYDIFYTYDAGLPKVPNNWIQLQNQAPPEDYLQGVDKNNNLPICAVDNFLVDGKHNVQLIGVLYPDPRAHFLNFDHSLTLGWYNKSGMFIHRKVYKTMNTHCVEFVSKNTHPDIKARSFIRAKQKIERVIGHQGPNRWLFKGFL